MTETSCDGKTSSPSVRNMAICVSQAMPSWKRSRLFLWMKLVVAQHNPRQVDRQEAAAPK